MKRHGDLRETAIAEFKTEAHLSGGRSDGFSIECCVRSSVGRLPKQLPPEVQLSGQCRD